MKKLISIIVISFGIGSLTNISLAQQTNYYVKPEIYRVTPEGYCVIKNEGQYRAMQGDQSPQPYPEYFDVLAGKTDLGECPWPQGLYKLSNYFGVTYVNGNSKCTINNETLLNAYGGVSRVNELPAGRNPFRAMKDLGECGWPSGLFKYADRPEVYKLDAAGFCQVTTQEQLSEYQRQLNVHQVTTVDRATSFTVNKKNMGLCPIANGFYRVGGRPEIYLLTDGAACHVTTGGQLNRLGGNGRVQKVSSNTNIYNGRKNNGSCGWPAGFYRKKNQQEIVYIADNNTLCQVRTIAQFKAMGGTGSAIVSVPASTNLRAGKRHVGMCN